ncbi:MAG: RNA-guided endonuclease InsQ/TnpB family protein [Vulcanimicrobiaceae bacterium]
MPPIWHTRFLLCESMTRRQGYVFELKPNNCEATALRRFAGCCRFVWNELLAMNELRHERGEPRMGYAAACGYLIALKDEYSWLAEVHSQPLQQTLKDLSRAYTSFFDPKLRAHCPAFKKKGQHIGVRFPQGFRVTNNAVYLPKVGWLGYRASRQIEGAPKSITVYQKAGHWFVSILTEREVEGAQHLSESIVGIDLGVNVFAALSTGEKIAGPNAFAKLERNLAHMQRELSRRTKFGKNWRKCKARISRLHVRIANVRTDALNKHSTTISKNHAVVIVEDLRIGNMTKSAKGTIEQPGTNVAQKAGLNRRILDQGWGTFARMLDYKLAWRGGLLVRINPRNTSRTCPACGHVAAENRTTRERFCCVNCGRTENADVNAAINIRERGLALIQGGTSPGVPVEGAKRPSKQETRCGYAA